SAKPFSMNAFMGNATKKVVQVGSWLRRLHSIYYLPVTRLRRAIAHQHVPYIAELFAAEKQAFLLNPDYGQVETLKYLSADEYDDLLAGNIVFLDLYDSSANNTILECIVRATPVLVNPLPAVKEYLGEGYPFYYVSRSQAARKVEDVNLIESAHTYLANHPIRNLLTREQFRDSVTSSEIYRNL
ncbi:MAG: tetratricopeptide repeat protein, partial [Acidobacteriota bacterium]